MKEKFTIISKSKAMNRRIKAVYLLNELHAAGIKTPRKFIARCNEINNACKGDFFIGNMDVNFRRFWNLRNFNDADLTLIENLIHCIKSDKKQTNN